MKNTRNNRFPCPETNQVSAADTLGLRSKSKQEIHSNSDMEFGNSSNNWFSNEGKGFPTKCECGSGIVKYVSQSIDNPGRPYFRCAASRKKGHLFEWVEDAMYDEVKELIRKSGRRESKSDDDKRMIEVNELMVEILNVKEEVLQCKTEFRKFKIKNMVVLVLCLCVLALLIIYHIVMHKSDGNTLAFGKM